MLKNNVNVGFNLSRALEGLCHPTTIKYMIQRLIMTIKVTLLMSH